MNAQPVQAPKCPYCGGEFHQSKNTSLFGYDETVKDENGQNAHRICRDLWLKKVYLDEQ